MKAILFALFVGLLMVGCGEDSPSTGDPKLDKFLSEATDLNKLKVRGELGKEILYAPNGLPYTGWVKRFYDNGQVHFLTPYKDGLKNGLETWWHENGQKSYERNYKDGNLMTAVADPLDTNRSDASAITDATSSHEDTSSDKKKVIDFGNTYVAVKLKSGKLHGPLTGWYKHNKQKAIEANYKYGKLMSAEVWKPNGEKCPHTNVKEGNGVLVEYENDGAIMFRYTYKTGEIEFRYTYWKGKIDIRETLEDDEFIHDDTFESNSSF